MATYLRSKKLNPADMQFTEDEQAKLDAAPPPEAPAVTVAKIGADTQLKLGAMKQQGDQLSIQHEQQVATAANALEGVKVQAGQEAVHVDATVQLHKELNDAKTQLAKTAMELQTERELNAQNNAANERKHRREMQQRNMPKPPVQVPGRARNGQAFGQA